MGFQRLMCEEGAGPVGGVLGLLGASKLYEAEVWTQFLEPSGGRTLKCAEMELLTQQGFTEESSTESVLMVE